jgi:AAA domain
MNSSPLVATVLINTSARHVIFIGDRHQLQPIGHGQPFADMIASKVIPTVYLTENFRTSCKGIQALCADVLSASVTPKKVPSYEELGGVTFSRWIGRTRPLWRPNCKPTWWMSGVIRIRSPLSAPTKMVTAGYAPSTRSCARRSACRIIGSPRGICCSLRTMTMRRSGVMTAEPRRFSTANGARSPIQARTSSTSNFHDRARERCRRRRHPPANPAPWTLGGVALMKPHRWKRSSFRPLRVGGKRDKA